jgi:hypothetical protein
LFTDIICRLYLLLLASCTIIDPMVLSRMHAIVRNRVINKDIRVFICDRRRLSYFLFILLYILLLVTIGTSNTSERGS